MKKVVEEAIEALIKKSRQSNDSNDALKFSQAAVNVGNAYVALQHAEELERTKP